MLPRRERRVGLRGHLARKACSRLSPSHDAHCPEPIPWTMIDPALPRLPSPHHRNRREILKLAAMAAGATWLQGCASGRRPRPGEKLRLAVIGCGGKGESDAKAVADENVIALCDVDAERAKATFAAFPNARRYVDWRELLQKETDLDGVIVSTPDHTHAAPAVAAMARGIHVFVQKPLTHTVEEARLLRAMARRMGVVTQMGNQGTAMDGFRAGVEAIRSGALGAIREVHVWTNRPIWAQGMARPKEIDAIPEHVRWDLWLGGAPYRPFHKSYLPFHWRGYWDFGTGALGDMGCHLMNLPYFALELGAPSLVVCESVEGLNEETGPKKSIVRYEFPARPGRGVITLRWYDGGFKPAVDLAPGLDKLSGGGSLIVGDQGTLLSADDYGATFQLLPKERFANWKAPAPTLRRVAGTAEDTKIHREWLDAIRGGPTPSSSFAHAGPFTEAVLLGNVAIRAGRPIVWDAESGRTDSADSDRWLGHSYRLGFELSGH